MNVTGRPAISATYPQSMAVQVNGLPVPIERAHPVKTRIDRIIAMDGTGQTYTAIAGRYAPEPQLAEPPPVPPGWEHVGLVMVLPAASNIYNGMITTLESWPHEPFPPMPPRMPPPPPPPTVTKRPTVDDIRELTEAVQELARAVRALAGGRW